MSLRPDVFDWVSTVVRRESAIVLDPGKEYLVESRLLPVARAAGHDCVDHYIASLRTRCTSGERAQVVEALTTNETFWFRDVEPFDVLRGTVIPELLRTQASRRRITVWSAGCSSGQEAYSIAMILAELVTPQGWQVEILATDISEQMLERTRAGVYSRLEVARGLPPAQLAKHFTRVGNSWQLSAELRAMVTVRHLNLAAPFPPLPNVDVVFLRNVLIYFDPETKRRILGQVKRVMTPDAYLFLGAAETTIGIDDAWERTAMGRFTLKRNPPGPSSRRRADQPVHTQQQ